MPDDVMEVEANDPGDVEQPEEQSEAEETAEPVEGEETPDGEDEGEQEVEEEEKPEEKPEEPAKSQSSGPMRGPLKVAYDSLRKTNPEGAQIVRANYFENQQFKQVFESPAVAAQAKQAYEDLGGEEGAQAIAQEREEWENVDRLVGEGKAAELLRDNPELLQKNAVGMINEFAKTAPEQYGYYADQVAINRVQQSGTLDVMGNLYKGLASFVQQNPELKPYMEPFIGQVVDAHNRIVDIGERAQQFAQKRTDPREEQLSRDRQQFEEQRRADFEERVYSDVQAYQGKAIDKAIDTLLNGRKADDDQRAIFREKITAELEKRLAQVQGFGSNLESHYRTGDRAKSVEYVNRQIDKILTAGKAAEVINPLLRSFNPVAAKPASKPSATSAKTGEAGTVIMRDFPDHSQIDWNRTSAADYAQGKAILTNGKRATGWA